jgi:branched-subunit amino acid aminotransferase/4-amino-4-deoxychorismate lyase
MDVEPRACINGKVVPLVEACLPVTDEGVARGYGAFETVGVWDGRPFRLAEHLDRLAASLEAILLPVPDRDVLEDDVARLLDGLTGDAALRLYVTGSGPRIVTLDVQPERVNAHHLVPQPAPWIRPRASYGPAGAKTMSYLPNMVASRAAEAAGGDDALLVSLDGTVLEVDDMPSHRGVAIRESTSVGFGEPLLHISNRDETVAVAPVVENE